MPVPYSGGDISPQLRNILIKNGMEAHLGYDNAGNPVLSMRAEGSPILYATLSPQEASKIEASNRYSPTGTAEKGAYNIIYNKATALGFKMPQYINAADTDPFVNIGLYGSRQWGPGIYPGCRPSYGILGALSTILPITPYFPPMRMTPYRNIGGNIYENYYNPLRPTAKVEPGGLAAGSNGVYYEPQAKQQKPSQVDIGAITPVKPWYETDMKKEPVLYSDKIKSSKDFTPEAFLEVLDSHGVSIDKDAKTLTIRTPTMAEPITWALSDATFEKIAGPVPSAHASKGKKKSKDESHSPAEARLKVINDLIKTYEPQRNGERLKDKNNQPLPATNGFTNDITMDMLNKKEYVNLIPSSEMTRDNFTAASYSNLKRVNDSFNALGYDRVKDVDAVLARSKAISFLNTHPEFAKLSAAEAQNYIAAHPEEFTGLDEYAKSFIVPGDGSMTPGGAGGRIPVHAGMAQAPYKTGFLDYSNAIGTVDGRALELGKGFYTPVKDGKAMSVGQIIAYPAAQPGQKAGCRMSAVINGEVYTRNISRKDYFDFINSDDETRLKIFDKNFDEVKIKNYRRGGGEQYNPAACNITQAAGVVSMKDKYSLVAGDGKGGYTAYIIESATAWHDKSSDTYTLSVRDGGDVGMWQFRMSAAQFEEWKNADDAHRAQMISKIGDFHDAAGNAYKAVSDGELLSNSAYKDIKMGAELNGVHLVSDVLTAETDKDGKLVNERVVKPADSTHPDGMLKSLDGAEAPGRSDKPVLDLTTGSHRHRYYSDLTPGEKAKFAETGSQYLSASGIHVREDQISGGQKDILLARLQSEGKLDISLDGTNGINYVSGQSRDGKMANRFFTRSGDHGRDTTVTDVRIQPKLDADGKVIAGKYTMSAVIDGAIVKHDINQKTVDKFPQLSDYGKLKLFDKIFPEVKMHKIPSLHSNLAANILMGLGAAAGIGIAIAGIGHRPHMDNAAGGFFYNNNVPGSDIVSQAQIQYEQQRISRQEDFVNRLGL